MAERQHKKRQQAQNNGITNAQRDRLRDDFRYFMAQMWEEMALPKPTRMQQLFADILQKSTDRKLILLGFRGFAKTLISACYTLWLLYRDPRLQIAFWGSNQDMAYASTELMLKWIQEIPWLQHLAPTSDMAQAGGSFDVQGRGIFRGSSVEAYGITGSVTGSRADYLVVDDAETSNNGDTVKKRTTIDRNLDEATYVIKDGGYIRALGTIHFDDSVYVRLLGKGYRIWIFPMAVPSKDTAEMCWDYYPEPVRKAILAGKEGDPLDRFSKTEIELKRQNGLLSYERQCICNPFRTSLSEKPLQLSKAIIFQADIEKLPIRFYHDRSPQHLDEDAMNFSSASILDKLYRPYKWDEKLTPYDRKIMYIDPAGGGKDETAVDIAGAANGYAVVFCSLGLIGGSKEENLKRIIELARRYKVDEICVEENFGQGMFAQLLRAYYFREYGRFGNLDTNGRPTMIPITEHRVTQKKERRIISILDPVLNFGRLIITPDALQVDFESANEHLTEDRMCYRLTYQISYYSEGGNKIEYDDRIDALASALEKLKPWLSVHPQDKAETYEDYLIKKVFSNDIFQQPAKVFQHNPITSIENRKSFL